MRRAEPSRGSSGRPRLSITVTGTWAACKYSRTRQPTRPSPHRMTCCSMGLIYRLAANCRCFSATIEVEYGLMDLDAKICYCFHITRRKLVNFVRQERPKVPSQLSE